MEKSLPHVSLHGKESQQKQAQLQPASNPPPEPGAGYDTHLLPHISLPQRQQQVIGRQQAGLLRYTSLATQHDANLTVGMSKYELARHIASAKQAQVTPSDSLSTPSLGPVSYAPPATFKQQHMQAQQGGAQTFASPAMPSARLVISPPGKYIGSERLRDIAHARTMVVIKALVALGLFVGVGCVIWALFSHNIIYLLVMFMVLAVMLGSILSTSMSDYYQLGLSKLKTTLHLQAIGSPRVSDALQGVRAPHLRMKNDTSGYLKALKSTFPKEQEGGSRM